MSRIVNRAATSPLAYQASGTFQQSTDASLQTMLGTRWDLEDGRELVMVLAGASNLAVGKLMQDAALISNHQNLAVTAFTAYSTTTNLPAQVTVTLGATLATVNQYQLGYAVVVDGTGAGQTLQIQSHPAAALSASVVITLADAPNTALDTTSKISLIPQPANNVIIYPHGAMTNAVRGVTFYPVTAANYGFLATKGNWACLADSTAPPANSSISPSPNTDGAIAETPYTGNFVTGAVIGYSKYATVSAKYYEVELDL
jgi:hypothetical protein